MNEIRIDITPYFKDIADYYWDHMDPATDGSIWEWLLKDYGVNKSGPGPVRERVRSSWVSFPDEQHLTMFLLRWS